METCLTDLQLLRLSLPQWLLHRLSRAQLLSCLGKPVWLVTDGAIPCCSLRIYSLEAQSLAAEGTAPVLWCLSRAVEGVCVRCLTQGSCVCHGGEAGLPLSVFFGIARCLKGAHSLGGETAQPMSVSSASAAFWMLTPSPSLRASRSVKDKGQTNGIMTVGRIWH